MGAAQAGAQGAQNIGGLITGIISAFSDMSLKDNAIVVGEYEGIEVIDWEWNEKAYNKYGFTGRSIGFNANKVQKTHPQYVTTTEDGTLMIDYPGILEELKNAGSNHSTH